MAVSNTFGTTITWNGQTVAKLSNIGGVSMSMSTTDVTTHQSTDSIEEFVAGLIKLDDIPIEGYFDPTDSNGQQAMLTDFYARTPRTAVITFPVATGTTWTFTAYITAIKIGDNPIEGAIPFTASIKPSGKPVLAVAASNNLSDLTITTATLYPAFAAGTYDYTATSTGASVTVTPTASAGVITVNGSTVTSGEASNSISLGSANTVTVITAIVTETNKAPRTYVIRVAKTA